MSKSLLKSIEELKRITAGRHPQSGSKAQADNSKAMAKMPADRPHIRADTQTEVNLKKADHPAWESSVHPEHFGPVAVSPTDGTIMVRANQGPHAGKWHYFKHNEKTGLYGAEHAHGHQARTHRDIFEKIVKPHLNAQGKNAEYAGITNSNMVISEGKRNPHHPVNAGMPIGEVKPLRKDQIPGGLADNKTNKDFDPKAIKRGEKVELEHTSNKRIADEIARDHLTEDPKYYQKLATIEKSFNINRVLQRLAERRNTTVDAIPQKHTLKKSWKLRLYGDPNTYTSIRMQKVGLESGYVLEDGRVVPSKDVESVVMLDDIKSDAGPNSNTADESYHPAPRPSLAKSVAADKETALIAENKKKPEAQKPHKFKAAKWTHPNGHPRCIICGDEERTGGVCEGLGKLKKSEPIGVSTVAVIDPIRKQILMGQRQDNGLWTTPGGHLEPGESPEDGALRELWEEAGVLCKLPPKYLGSERIIGQDDQEREIHCFAVYARPQTTGIFDPDEEVKDWKWVSYGNGLPIEISQNLHAKKNVLFKLLGIK